MPRHNAIAMNIRELPDDNLVAQAREWRLRALRGEKKARGIAHELEREVRRRFAQHEATTIAIKEMRPLGELSQGRQQRWKPW